MAPLSADEIVNHIRKRFPDSSFDVQHLSSELKLSESYLREIIHLNFGVCPHHLIETIKLEEAVRLLAEGNIKVYEACSLAGYARLRTFRRAFKKRTGLQPVEFRKIIKKSKSAAVEMEKMTACLWDFSSQRDNIYR